MSAIHVLERLDERFHCVVHKAIPAGNNAAGFSWKSVCLAAGMNKTVLAEGTGPGQISTAEKASVLAGDTLEIEMTIAMFSGGVTIAQVNALVDGKYANWLTILQQKYDQWGRVYT
jgi:hypothetical protein